MLKSITCLILASLIYNLSSAQNPLIQKVGPGDMDWEKYKISVIGIGPKGSSSKGSLAEARKDAVQKLYQTVLNLSWDCHTKVGDQLNKSQLKKLENLISKEFKMVDKQRYNATGDCEIEVELALPGNVFDLILPPASLKLKEVSQQNLPSSPPDAFTGLIIDATGLKVVLNLTPKIVNLQGEEIYGISWVERSWANTWGLVAYATGNSDFQRAGDKPQYVKALKIAEDGCSLVVSTDNLAKTLTTENLIALSHCKVILLTDTYK